MQKEIKQCQNCKQNFVIEPEDFEFYEKIKVPAPTWCPKCRFQRRISFQNLMNLYKRKCDLCGKDSVSMYAPEAPVKVYCPDCWWSDKWDAYEYGRDYDFSRPFFEQIKELWREAPLLGLSIGKESLATSPYTNHTDHLKNCYLVFNADFNEDCAYGLYLLHSKSTLDSSLMHTCELLYDCVNSFKTSRCIGTRNQTQESFDCAFCSSVSGCQNCFASVNLRNKKYHIFNKPYSKEDYFKEIAKYNLGSYKTYQEVKKLAEEHWKKYPPKPRYDDFSVNSTGNYVFQSKNCKECYEVGFAEDCKFISMLCDPPIKDCYDVSFWGNNLTLAYECNVVGENASNMRFCQEAGINLHSAEYCKLSTGGSNHFGCVAVKKGDYAILNKRYEKEEFEELRARIIKHMDEMPYVDKNGRVYKYGEFFPNEVNPYAYNETIVSNFFPLSKEEAEKQGYWWREEDKKEYQTTKKSAELPDHIKDAPDNILQDIIECQKCARGYKIIPMEFKFLREMNLPLPRECPFCRINEKFAIWVKNLRIFKRECSKCGADFETSYPQDEVPYILCKECYQGTLE
ncbi:MAG: hypothetical protein A2931_02565 [Candidatus Niyogibacteria bacterium RIFCSPLOWO2_01_FULL_45_48]|uniref:Zinc-binding domain-containing protein n=2 Tax=Candidatus Niyogiibacteriota TaxID=1817912 RepID=A0A1G2F162_9BACT|nr:MAG: hypothetical protein A2835_03125 [Candidatus Niyogibacteria bacterium RIFCSPHIGHO2_01_FULL_45_28]OGZ30970.1 MAG: hypothetical protein A2931_02565 [Candidatus Niyogibacteria bacterium RIFCSPLOWO2_01_FULL_45_48]OGZ31380.1 MAG: hypothetical protein A3J00_02005 [Candidatus Niyogibacteria bacterium RIFCSPLOWO2_02_FULL_45_13]